MMFPKDVFKQRTKTFKGSWCCDPRTFTRNATNWLILLVLKRSLRGVRGHTSKLVSSLNVRKCPYVPSCFKAHLGLGSVIQIRNPGPGKGKAGKDLGQSPEVLSGWFGQTQPHRYTVTLTTSSFLVLIGGGVHSPSWLGAINLLILKVKVPGSQVCWLTVLSSSSS